MKFRQEDASGCQTIRARVSPIMFLSGVVLLGATVLSPIYVLVPNRVALLPELPRMSSGFSGVRVLGATLVLDVVK